jgi:hypothetical protein
MIAIDAAVGACNRLRATSRSAKAAKATTAGITTGMKRRIAHGWSGLTSGA